ncbi:MAG: adenylosuccinate synthase [Saprospiraceae bacterium]|nr:adenylosuccinate synthase [Saprospiraceae bacterium]
MAIDVILGLQWGDEGKGKIVDLLSPRYHLVARFQGGPNAGHTLKFGGKKYVLHTVPSGIFRENLINLIGNGVVIDPITLAEEIRQLDLAGVDYHQRLLVSRKAHLILPTHRYLDAASEKAKGKSKIGSTLRGIGPTYMDKTGRNGLRVGDIQRSNFREKFQALKAKHLNLLKLYPDLDFDLEKEEKQWFESLKILQSLPAVDGEYYLARALSEGRRILAEGAQGSMLDIDYGTYPYVTSSNTLTAGVCIGLGVPPGKIGEVIGISKAYCTRVGSGPFPTEDTGAAGQMLREKGAEFGATTGRPRRCGWIDLPQLKYTLMLNGVTQLAITKIDVLNDFEEIQMATAYRYDNKETDHLPFDICDVDIEPVYSTLPGWRKSLDNISEYHDLPIGARGYLEALERALDVPVTMVSTGPERSKIIFKEVKAQV